MPKNNYTIFHTKKSYEDISHAFYLTILDRLDIGPSVQVNIHSKPEQVIPHARLRHLLQCNAAMSALLPGMSNRIALGDQENIPFSITSSALVVLSPVLLEDSEAAAAIARWAIEASFIRSAVPHVRTSHLCYLLKHGAKLIAMLPSRSRKLVEEILPPAFLEENKKCIERPDHELLQWQASLVDGAVVDEYSQSSVGFGELETPLEMLLISGGDSRLCLDKTTSKNVYGVPPRPRPEAIHFSSSTASAISDYGFFYCDLFRRDLLAAYINDDFSVEQLRKKVSDAIGSEILVLLNLGPEDADIAITPSGTDTELLAVLVSRSGARKRPLCNILIAPEESGQGVLLAGSGCYFDDNSRANVPITKGVPVWPEGPIPLHKIQIRDENALPRSMSDIDADFLKTASIAIDNGYHVLVHLLLASKTGLSAPSLSAIELLVTRMPGRVDVVVDACQMRTPFRELGGLVRKGWMVQISGSKFLTGPPFSGALVVPASMQQRATAVGEALVQAPGIGHASDWTCRWSSHMPVSGSSSAGFGPLFRWLPALLEARLLSSLSNNFRREAFYRFRTALTQFISQSKFIKIVETGGIYPEDDTDALSRLTITSFQVLGLQNDGSLLPLNAASCRKLFEYLNKDVSDEILLPDEATKILARQEAHLGQPVTLSKADGQITALRMVIGARFFNILGKVDQGSFEAALVSEISDAKRAIKKIELLAAYWPCFEKKENPS